MFLNREYLGLNVPLFFGTLGRKYIRMRYMDP